MLTVIISYRRIGDDPQKPFRIHTVEEVASPLAAANEAQRFCLDNLDAEIIAINMTEARTGSFSISGYIRTVHAEETADNRLAIAQHLELALAEYLDSEGIPLSEVQVKVEAL